MKLIYEREISNGGSSTVQQEGGFLHPSHGVMKTLYRSLTLIFTFLTVLKAKACSGVTLSGASLPRPSKVGLGAAE